MKDVESETQTHTYSSTHTHRHLNSPLSVLPLWLF